MIFILHLRTPSVRYFYWRWALVAAVTLLAALVPCLVTPAVAQPLDDTITYQGQLQQNGQPANGFFDLVLNLYDDPDPLVGTLIATTTALDVMVEDSLFTVALDLGSVWNGDKRWLEVEVAVAGSGIFTTLSPTQPLTAAPYAHYAREAGDAAQLGGVDATDYLQASGGDLALSGVIQTGATAVSVAYNRHGTAVSNHGLSDAQDLMVSDDLEVEGDLFALDITAEDDVDVGGQLSVGSASDTNTDTIFFDGSERLEWDESQARFEISDALATVGPIRVGTIGGTPVGYSAFGSTASPASGDMANDSDVYVHDDLEVGSQIYLSGELRMDTEEGDQRIYFYEAGNQQGEALVWDDSETHLEWSDDLAISGALQVGNTTGALSYNRFGTGVPVAGIVSTIDDVLVSDDLEVLDDVDVGDSIRVVDDVDVGGQLSVGSASSTNSDTIFFDGSERLEWDESQSRFEISDDLATVGPIRVGTIGGTPADYSIFGDLDNPLSGDITDDEDVYIGEDLEVGEVLYLNGELHMGLAESDQSIYFFDEGSQTRNRFYWDDAFDQFRLTDTFNIDGTLIANSKNFRIDHPLDPRGKYLFHTSVESPDMMTVYNGNVTTDGQGDAVVVLPAYFEALNRDYRYQLTPIGVFSQAIVAEEIVDNRFVVKTDQPYVKVSWQVTGVRQDAWAKANRVEPEVRKPGHERGTLLWEDRGPGDER